MEEIKLNSIRAQKARLAKKIGKQGYEVLVALSFLFIVGGASLLYLGYLDRLGYLGIGLGVTLAIVASWYHLELDPLPTRGKGVSDILSADVLNLLPKKQKITIKDLWDSLTKHWQAIFIFNHLMLTKSSLDEVIDETIDEKKLWEIVLQLSKEDKSETIEPVHILAVILLGSKKFEPTLAQFKLSIEDFKSVADWLSRGMKLIKFKKPYFGGIGRDWAYGFTELISRFGTNVTLLVENGGGYYSSLVGSKSVSAIKESFAKGANNIALVGEIGIGKTSHVFALAQSLLEENKDKNLAHRQIIGLNPSLIISNAKSPGELEQIVYMILMEAVHAGHVILFLDDARLFFQSGPGSFDITQILLPIVQSNRAKIIFAMTPTDYQTLRAKQSAFASLLIPIILTEPSENETIEALQDNALTLESKHNVIYTHQAIKAAYRLSGRYDKDTAYPGKAVKLMEESLPYSFSGIVIELSVEQAIEQTYGVKVGTATVAEKDTLLNLEEKIHERMINQERAVSVVSNALRRARAGVSSPKRPIGSFLFLGPTGVGKTELAKSLAAVYFGDETSMIRIDMSEYQQENDVSRILSDGTSSNTSLIMAARQHPFSVILLDEVEKAHPNILNLLLQLLDEGQLTDTNGRVVSFKDCIIIATSNAGAQEIRERIDKGEKLESFEASFVDQLISSNQFKPELINRFDEVVLFRPLNKRELQKIVSLMMKEVNQTLEKQKISVELTDAAVEKIVSAGYDSRLGARPMRRVLQKAVEDNIANKILKGEAKSGDHIKLDNNDLSL